jgi:large subunit ribosomal protein L11
MAKKVKAQIKFLIEGGNATPGQKIGPALGQQGVNIGEFVSKFNEKTADRRGQLVPVILTVYEDRTFIMAFKQSPVSFLITKAIGIKKGSATPNTSKVGKLTKAQVKEIAQQKLADLNTRKIDSAMRIVAGTAKSMGVDVI